MRAFLPQARLWLARRQHARALDAFSRWDEARWAAGQPALINSQRRREAFSRALEELMVWGSILTTGFWIPTVWLPAFQEAGPLRSFFLLGALTAPCFPVCLLGLALAALYDRLAAPGGPQREILRQSAQARLEIASRRAELEELRLATRASDSSRPSAARRVRRL